MAEIELKELNKECMEAPARLVERAEDEYHDRILRIAEKIVNAGGIRLVLIAGPSGSGKTTTANLISDRIKTLGKKSKVLSLDDFYRDREDPDYPRRKDGCLDYECPESLDLPKLTDTLQKIINGEEYILPKYDFKLGRATSEAKHPSALGEIIIIEGLHAINPLISDCLPKSAIYKIFISVSTNINDGNERILSGRKIRFVRRLVRDSIYRGADARRTLDFWSEVLRGEDIYLYPHRHLADISFDTFHMFEPPLMKRFALKLLTEELASEVEYVRIIREAMLKMEELDEELVPENSLIREFISGGTYHKIY